MMKTCEQCNKRFDGDNTDKKCKTCYAKGGFAVLAAVGLMTFVVIFSAISAVLLGIRLFQ